MDSNIDHIFFTINNDDNQQKDVATTRHLESSPLNAESKMLLPDVHHHHHDTTTTSLLLYDSINPTATLEVSSTMIINESSSNSTQNDGQKNKKLTNNNDDNIQMEYHFNPLYVISDRQNQSQNQQQRSIQDQELEPIRNDRIPPIYSSSSSTFVHEFSTSPSSSLPVPRDQYGLIYISLIMAGVGFLLPYNSFMIAVDYFQQRFPDTTIVFDMSATYIVMTFFTVIIQNLFVEIIPFRWRLNFGYLVALLFMMFAVIWEIWLRLGSYLDNLIIISIIAVGCSVQQSTFYGYTSMLPKRYVQAVMIGESAAGVFVSFNRIITKILYPTESEFNTVLFFSISIIVISICAIVHVVLLPRSNFIRYHLYLCRDNDNPNNRSRRRRRKFDDPNNARIIHQINENVGLVNMYHRKESEAKFESNTQTSMLSMDSQQQQQQIFNDQQPVVADVIINNQNGNNSMSILNRTANNQAKVQNILRTDSTEFAFFRFIFSFMFFSYFSDNNLHRILITLHHKYLIRRDIILEIWPFISTIIIVYLVTLTIFPGIESEIHSCRFGDWFPIILMAIFNLTDFFGKLMSTLFFRINHRYLLLIAFGRFILIPLFVWSILPHQQNEEQPFFANAFWPISFTILLGITNGVFGSLPMILAPFKVNEQWREITGNLMTFSYIIGLTAGSFCSYWLNNWTLSSASSSSSLTLSSNHYRIQHYCPSELAAITSTTTTTTTTVATTIKSLSDILLNNFTTSMMTTTMVSTPINNLTTIMTTSSLNMTTTDISSMIIDPI
nr:equilibrative nucleoside transporter 4-like [Dermatophagoides farinae]